MRHQEVLMGRVGQIKDIHELDKGNCVVNFSVAETPRMKKGDKWVDGTTIWTNVTIFGDEARNLHRSVKPGNHVIVIGHRQASEYTARDSDEKRVSQSVIAEQVGVAITKFDFVDTLGNVNYSKDGKASTSKSGGKKTSKKASKPKTSNEDPFNNDSMDDPFGGEDDPFGLSD